MGLSNERAAVVLHAACPVSGTMRSGELEVGGRGKSDSLSACCAAARLSESERLSAAHCAPAAATFTASTLEPIRLLSVSVLVSPSLSISQLLSIAARASTSLVSPCSVLCFMSRVTASVSSAPAAVHTRPAAPATSASIAVKSLFSQENLTSALTLLVAAAGGAAALHLYQTLTSSSSSFSSSSSLSRPAAAMSASSSVSLSAPVYAKKPVVVTVTGAAGQIGYSIIFLIAGGKMLGPDQPIELRLLDMSGLSSSTTASVRVSLVQLSADECYGGCAVCPVLNAWAWSRVS
jgi:hypothetical protein